MAKLQFDEKEQDFATLLENSFTDVKTFVPGEIIDAQIVAISGGCAFIQLDGKSEGQIDLEELLDDKKKVTVNVGDTIKAYFVEAKSGDKIFTTKISGNKVGKDALKSAYENEIPVEGTVSSVIKGGYEIKLGDTRAFCPFSQIGLSRVDDSNALIGTTHTFKIIEYSENGRNILVSSRILLEKEREDKIDTLKEEIKLGSVVKCKVLSLEKFGAFVEVKGIKALLPISEISRARVENLEEVIQVGDELTVKIINLDWNKEKISVSLKELITDPWSNAINKYEVDSKYSGTVTRIVNFGVFVQLEPGIEGLIHEMDFKNISKDRGKGDNLKQGQNITVIIQKIDSLEKRISLKEVISDKEYQENKKYYDSEDSDSEDTYNPFAAFFNKK